MPLTDLTQSSSGKRSKVQMVANAKSEKRAREKDKSDNKSNKRTSKRSNAEQPSSSDSDLDCDTDDDTSTKTPGGDESHDGSDSERPEMNTGGLCVVCFLRT